MGRFYTAAFDGIVQSAGGNLWEFQAASDKPTRIHSIFYGFSEYAVAPSTPGDLGQLLLQRMSGSGSGGTVVGANPLDPGDATDGATFTRHRTGTIATPTEIFSETFNWEAGWFWRPEADDPFDLGGDDVLSLDLTTPVVEEVTTSMTLVFEEIG